MDNKQVIYNSMINPISVIKPNYESNILSWSLPSLHDTRWVLLPTLSQKQFSIIALVVCHILIFLCRYDGTWDGVLKTYTTNTFCTWDYLVQGPTQTLILSINFPLFSKMYYFIYTLNWKISIVCCQLPDILPFPGSIGMCEFWWPRYQLQGHWQDSCR